MLCDSGLRAMPHTNQITNWANTDEVRQVSIHQHAANFSAVCKAMLRSKTTETTTLRGEYELLARLGTETSKARRSTINDSVGLNSLLYTHAVGQS